MLQLVTYALLTVATSAALVPRFACILQERPKGRRRCGKDRESQLDICPQQKVIMQVLSLGCFCVNKPYDNNNLYDGSRARASAIPYQ